RTPVYLAHFPTRRSSDLERLDYANLSDGDLTHSHLPELRGLSMRGSWIPDFEELVHYAEKEIPSDDGILLLPGEDLFYYVTGRRSEEHTSELQSRVDLVC